MTVATKPTMELLLRLVVEQGATDLHLSANLAPHIRLDDRLVPTDHPPLSGDEVKELAYSLLSPDKVERFERWKELDFAFSVEGLARFRANYFVQQGYVGVAIRMLPFRILNFNELGLPVQVVTDLVKKPKGLVLITGATGSGKSTTLAAMVNVLRRLNLTGEGITTAEQFEQRIIDAMIRTARRAKRNGERDGR